MLKDTVNVSTFAVATSRCLQVGADGGMFLKTRNMAWKRALLANEKMIPEVATEKITMTVVAYTH